MVNRTCLIKSTLGKRGKGDPNLSPVSDHTNHTRGMVALFIYAASRSPHLDCSVDSAFFLLAPGNCRVC